MDFQWNEEQEMLRQTVRSFAEKELRPIAFTHEGRGDYPQEIYREMAEMGLLGRSVFASLILHALLFLYLGRVMVRGGVSVFEPRPDRYRISLLPPRATARPGERVNLERALRFSDRLDGHLVSGHIDGTGSIKAIGTKANATILTIGVEAALSRYMIEKGSVAVDGISLTINQCTTNRFEVSIIPHTWLATTLRLKKNGATVNIETDMIGKYVERFSSGRGGEKTAPSNRSDTVDKYFTTKKGYL